jgi:hypothetical protein
MSGRRCSLRSRNDLHGPSARAVSAAISEAVQVIGPGAPLDDKETSDTQRLRGDPLVGMLDAWRQGVFSLLEQAKDSLGDVLRFRLRPYEAV